MGDLRPFLPHHLCRCAQFFLRIYKLALQASFRADFTVEQLMKEPGLVIDKLWLSYERAAIDAGLPKQSLGAELVLGGWSPKSGRMVATAYAKNDSTTPAIVQQLDGGLASPGEPLRGRPDSFASEDVLAAARLQANYLNEETGRQVAGGRLLIGLLQQGHAVMKDLGAI
ncbi:hypothetical protein [Stenotrophomonas geniculata]|jgi:hypothetical protein|uniref:hypothetical protein n=1 Tax=Stenotrophomonas geniculata TaxID=86188 RepID=UPI00128B624C|nr:hypothetical protein [Stenotrophomonas geniculata]MBH1485399.1 hypothetical protein [Stenotrophomonas maltophilia]MBN5138214.1 hypothetical protein [Stenotrophomonas maltophilia]MDH7548220.1 hypothetical protein [Stenotrophomonas geniculata]